MNCRECRDKLSLYIDGQLTAEETVRLENALERCPDCAAELEALTEIVAELGELGEVDVPTDLLADLKDAFRNEVAQQKASSREPSFAQRMGRWRIAASIMALGFAVWVVYLDQANTPAPKAETTGLSASTDEIRRLASEENLEEMEVAEREEAQFGSADDEDTSAQPRINKKPKSIAKNGEEGSRSREVPGMVDKSAKTKSPAPAEGRALTLDDASRSVVVREYKSIESDLKEHTGVDFEAEPLDQVMLAFLRKSSLVTESVEAEKKMRKSASPAPMKKARGNSKRRAEKTELPAKRVVQSPKSIGTQSWSKSEPSASAYFALGQSSGSIIREEAKKAGLKVNGSQVKALAGSKNSRRDLVTIEMTEAERDALLKTLGDKRGLQLKLFGRNNGPLVAKSDMPKPPAKSEGDVAKGRQADGKKASPETGSRKVRVSFIILKP